MTPNELRIGNKIQYSDDGTVFEVEQIYSDGLDVKNDNEETYIEIEYFEGIKLTEEWLLNFGFAKFGSFYSVFYGSNYHSFTIPSNEGDLRFVIDEHGIITTSIKYNHIRHVHSLQNLYFALTNKELTLTT